MSPNDLQGLEQKLRDLIEHALRDTASPSKEQLERERALHADR